MKHSPYMAANEMQEYMWLWATKQILERVINTTQDKVWLRRMRTALNGIRKIMDERAKDFDEKEKKKANRRTDNLEVKVASKDYFRVEKAHDNDYPITIGSEDLYDLMDAALLNCYGCPQGEVVKDCPRRALFHRLGMQVHAYRENPAAGECEFRYENSQRAVTPQYKHLQQDLIDTIP